MTDNSSPFTTATYGDTKSKAALVIDIVHARIHQGVMFTATFSDLAWLSAEVHDIGFVVPAKAEPHTRFKVVAGGDAQVQFYEDAVFSGGTPLQATNRNRTSAGVAKMQLASGVLVSSPGSLLEDILIAGGNGPRTAGASSEFFQEWILKPAASYLLRLTNLSGSSQMAGVEIDFYERP